MHSIDYGTEKIHYNVHRQNRQDVKISVDLVDGVVVYVSEDVTDDKLSELVSGKARWISEKLADLQEVQTNVQPKEFVSGEKLPYLGRSYRLKLHRAKIDKATIGMKQGKFIATVPDTWPQKRASTL